VSRIRIGKIIGLYRLLDPFDSLFAFALTAAAAKCMKRKASSQSVDSM